MKAVVIQNLWNNLLTPNLNKESIKKEICNKSSIDVMDNAMEEFEVDIKISELLKIRNEII
jgi:hypothetical protein